jgi:hypothetical protein
MHDPFVPLELDLGDLGPISETRPIDMCARRLVVDTGLRGVEATGAWVTVSDEAGAVLFEGAPGADGCVNVAFEGIGVERVRILFETARLHRQAEVTLHEGVNAHAFG